MYDIPLGFHFRVTFDPQGKENDVRFQEVSGISMEISTESVKEGGELRFEHKLPSLAQYPNLVLKRGYLTDSGIIDWIRSAIENFDFEPRTAQIDLLNEEHEPLVSWQFVNVIPLKWSISDLNATNNALVIESLEFSYNYFTQV